MVFSDNTDDLRQPLVLRTVSPGASVSGVVYNVSWPQGVAITQAMIALDTRQSGFPETILVNKSANIVATECQLTPYISEFKPAVIRSTYTEENVVNKTLPPSATPFGEDDGECQSLNALSMFLWAILSGSMDVVSDSISFIPSNTYGSYATGDVLQAFFYGNFTGCPNPNDRLGCTMDKIARALSKSFRDAPVLATRVQNPQRGIVSVGQTLVSVVYVEIEWGWLFLPLLIWVLSVVVWFAAIYKTRQAKIPYWRVNTLPLLFLSSGKREEGFVGGGCSDAALTKRADKTQVRLVLDQGQARFVGLG
jgi:hypothetical protein